MSEDPERLLRRLRAAPSPAFLARLKARLDAQTPSGRPFGPLPLRGLLSGHRPIRAASRPTRLQPWHVALPVLVGCLALTFMSLPLRHAREAPAQTPPVAIVSVSQHSTVPLPGAALHPAPGAAAGSAGRPIPRRARQGSAVPAQPVPAPEPQLTASSEHPMAPGKTPAAVDESALAPYVQDLPQRFLIQHGFYNLAGMRIEAVSSAPGPCAGDASGQACPQASEPGIQKTLIGHEVAFLARSAQSGALPLSSRAIFLALAQDVPDPSHPQLLVSNPYRLWSDIDPALPPDPIRVLGPPQSSQPGGALLAVLLEPGCHQVLPPSTSESQCQAVRSDDVYEEVPEYESVLVGELTAHPSWLGLLNLELLAQGGEELAVSPMNDVTPAAASILSGAYPAARSVYLSVRNSDLRSRPVLANLVFRYRQLVDEGGVGGPQAALVSSEQLQSQLPSLP